VTTAEIQQPDSEAMLRVLRLNQALSAWDEYDTNEMMPSELRHHVERPALSRMELESLHQVLAGRLAEFEPLYPRF
jgi:hypothetical protein